MTYVDKQQDAGTLPTLPFQLRAVRIAGLPLEGAHSLHSQLCLQAVRKYCSLNRRLGVLVRYIEDALYMQIGETEGAAERAHLLRLKRSIHNGRTPLQADLPLLPRRIEKAVHRYLFWTSYLGQLPMSLNGEAVRDVRQQLHAALDNPYLRANITYSSQWVLHALGKSQRLQSTDFSRAERTVCVYLEKTRIKANPFYLFASCYVPEVSPHEDMCEVVIDTELLLRVEQSLIRRSPLNGNIRLFMASHLVCGQQVLFLTGIQNATKVVRLGYTPILRAVVDHIKAGGDVTIASCVSALHHAFRQPALAVIESFVSRLIALGILTPYLVQNFDNFADDLCRLPSPFIHQIGSLQEEHLRRVSIAQIPAVHERLVALADIEGPLEEFPYFVNWSRVPRESTPQPFLGQVAADFQEVRPFFQCGGNFSATRLDLRDRVITYLKSKIGTSANFMEVVFHLAGHRHTPGENSPEDRKIQADALLEWNRHLSRLEGSLTATTREATLRGKPARIYEGSMNLIGQVDHSLKTFYLDAVLAGGPRYTSRYALNHRAHASSPQGAILAVQLAFSISKNRHYVRSIYRAGCGFEGRYRNRFEEWIEPWDVELRLDHDDVKYTHVPSGRELEFKYVGFLVAEALPLNYQLLLLQGHEDHLVNPFTGFSELDLQPNQSVHRAALHSGSLCLRREAWHISVSLFKPILEPQSILHRTLKLAWLLDCQTAGLEQFYYVAHSSHNQTGKPRYVNLGNPLTVDLLLRDIQSMNADESVAIMSPQPSVHESWRVDGRPTVTEWMLGV